MNGILNKLPLKAKMFIVTFNFYQDACDIVLHVCKDPW